MRLAEQCASVKGSTGEVFAPTPPAQVIGTRNSQLLYHSKAVHVLAMFLCSRNELGEQIGQLRTR